MQTDLVTIEVVDQVTDALKRIALLNGALFRVLCGVRLIEVLDANYEAGRIRLLVETRRSRPRVSGRVSVSYEPADTRVVRASLRALRRSA